ncbi:MAG: hypothetical protein N2109_03450 [Fimbriimonadales bacterium]|nr:hypothetical protein [Fimbriimonadales bacterium]
MALSIVLAAALASAGGVIRGTFKAAGYPEGTMVRVGYVARIRGGETIFDHAGFSIGPGPRSARCDTFRPRFAEVFGTEPGVYRFRLGSLPAGDYVVYARVGETRMGWGAARPGFGQPATLGLRADPNRRSALRVLVPKAGGYLAWLQPRKQDGKPALAGLKPADWNIETESRGGACDFADLEPGCYTVTLVSYRELEKNAEGFSRVLEEAGTWVVRLEAGKRLTIQLRP